MNFSDITYKIKHNEKNTDTNIKCFLKEIFFNVFFRCMLSERYQCAFMAL